MKRIYLALVVLFIAACSGDPSSVSKPEIVYRDGEHVCLTTGSVSQTVTLRSDVEEGQTTVLAELRDGSNRLVDVVYLSEQINCGMALTEAP